MEAMGEALREALREEENIWRRQEDRCGSA